jgi:hypothetical protein
MNGNSEWRGLFNLVHVVMSFLILSNCTHDPMDPKTWSGHVCKYDSILNSAKLSISIAPGGLGDLYR